MSLNSQGSSRDNIATGSTAQRPGSPSKGDVRYNTNLNRIEYWDGAKWNSITSVESIGNATFNMGSGAGVKVSGSNPTMNQSGTTDRKFTFDKAWGDALYKGGTNIDGISLELSVSFAYTNWTIQNLKGFGVAGVSFVKDTQGANVSRVLFTNVQPDNKYVTTTANAGTSASARPNGKVVRGGAASSSGLFRYDTRGFCLGFGGESNVPNTCKILCATVLK